MTVIEAFDIFMLPCPLGRTIGDNSCSYDEMVILAVCLKTNSGHIAWGYTEMMTSGKFKNEAWWVRPLPKIPELKQIFLTTWWDALAKKNPMQLNKVRVSVSSADRSLDKAVRCALWDLMGHCVEQPLYKMLGGISNTKRAYGSLLDFHLSDSSTVQLVKSFVQRGFKTIKVKIGAPDPARDINRLLLVKGAAGEDVSITADANEAWDWQTTLSRLQDFEKAGISLEYLEDPLPRNDIAGIRQLTERSPIPIIGNDYVDSLEDIRKVTELGGLKGLRTFKDFDYMIGCLDIAEEHNIPVYIGNSQFEISAHVAVAFSRVKYIEFADLGWNELVVNPLKFIDGCVVVPDVPGHGLTPKPELLRSKS